MKYLVNLDLNQNELQNVKIQNLGTAPLNPVKGQVYFNTASNTYMGYNGSEWLNLGYKHPSTHTISQISGLQDALDSKAANGHTHNQYTNQNAFSNVKVGSSTIAADTTTDTLEIVAGSNITITPDTATDKITIAANVPAHPSGLHVTKEEKEAWNAKESTTGSQAKADKALADAKSYADTKVASLVNGAPEQLDTLKELADAIEGNQAGVSDLLEQIGTKANTSFVTEELAKKANNGHTHSNYAAVGHNHDTAYRPISYVPSWGEITGKPSSFTPASHNQAANTITAMTGYVKALSADAISATDSLNVAIGKLEKAIEGKQAAGSYAPASHTSDNTVHVTASERSVWNAKSNLTLGTSSSTAFRGDQGLIAYNHSQAAHAPLNAQKNSDITKAEIEAKLTGAITSHTHNYASSGHNHHGTYTRKYAANIGDGANNTIKVSHNLGTEDVTVSVIEVATKQVIFADVTIIDSNSLNVAFASAPSSNAFRVIVIG